jgi:lysozyme
MFDHILAYELAEDEAFRTTSYLDTKNNWTIGIGHLLGKSSEFANITWSPTRVMITFMQDMNSAISYTHQQIHTFDQLSHVRQRVLVNMMFNLGPNRFSGFINTINAINSLDYYRTYLEMLDSKWAREDVPQRATRLADRMLHG